MINRVKSVFGLLSIKIQHRRSARREKRRDNYCKKRRVFLKNKDFSLLSNNCNGGVILHELGVRFNTPTINLGIDAPSFIEYLKNIEFYNEQELTFITTGDRYPVAKIGDKIIIRFIHYKSISEAKRKWDERKKRLNFNNLFILMTQQPDEGCDDSIVKEFDSLPFKNKVIFTNKYYPTIKSSIYLEKYKDNPHGVYMFLDFINEKSARRHLDVIDWIDWFNSGSDQPHYSNRK